MRILAGLMIGTVAAFLFLLGCTARDLAVLPTGEEYDFTVARFFWTVSAIVLVGGFCVLITT